MAVATTIILVVLIISSAILFGIYMTYCSNDGIKMFEDPEYDKRISKLEEMVEQLKEEK